MKSPFVLTLSLVALLGFGACAENSSGPDDDEIAAESSEETLPSKVSTSVSTSGS